jgi:hypothetical protein
MIIQGGNTPIKVTFSDSVTDMPTLVATLWNEKGEQLKKWEKADMRIEGDTATLPLDEDETATFPSAFVFLEIKGVDDVGQILFWQKAQIRVYGRNDKIIDLIN